MKWLLSGARRHRLGDGMADVIVESFARASVGITLTWQATRALSTRRAGRPSDESRVVKAEESRRKVRQQGRLHCRHARGVQSRVQLPGRPRLVRRRFAAGT